MFGSGWRERMLRVDAVIFASAEPVNSRSRKGRARRVKSSSIRSGKPATALPPDRTIWSSRMGRPLPSGVKVKSRSTFGAS
jgi:hypothetical protein